jgi:filamentous hemagglutinin family protein
MQINQTSQQAIVNWQGFSIAPNEAVNIQQPNANAALLNRVVGQDASQIQGQLNANGQVYLVNPNGVVFGKTAQVDVGGIVATTHDISNPYFLNGKNHFTQNGATGSVENHGTINSKDGGVVALIGEQVTNTGKINTPKGTTALAAGKTVDLDMKGDELVEVNVSEAALNAQISNQGAISTDGGRVVMTAKAANALIVTFNGTEFTPTGLQNNETIATVSFAVGWALPTSNATGGTFDANNYTISYVAGALSINPAPLTITALAANKTYDGLAYSGGNGVSYTGLVNGETSGVLAGLLSYGGNAQGAVNAITYKNGMLTVASVQTAVVQLPSNTLEPIATTSIAQIPVERVAQVMPAVVEPVLSKPITPQPHIQNANFQDQLVPLQAMTTFAKQRVEHEDVRKNRQSRAWIEIENSGIKLP